MRGYHLPQDLCFKIQQKPFQANVVLLNAFHFVDPQDFAVHCALYWVTSSLFPNWRSFLSLHGNLLPIFNTLIQQTLLPPIVTFSFLPASRTQIQSNYFLQVAVSHWTRVPWRQGRAFQFMYTCVYVPAHWLSSVLRDTCCAPGIMLDTGFQHSGTEWRNFFSRGVHVNVYALYMSMKIRGLHSMKVNTFSGLLTWKTTNYWFFFKLLTIYHHTTW